MNFTPKEKILIYSGKYFIKKFNNKEYYVKAFYKYENIIPLIDIESAYKKYLIKYFKNHLPDYNFVKFHLPKKYIYDDWGGKEHKRLNLTLFIQEKIEGTRIKNLAEFKKLINLPINAKFKEGMKKMFQKDNATLLLCPSKKYNFNDTFIIARDKKLIYTDSRNPVVFNDKCSNKKNFELLKKLIY